MTDSITTTEPPSDDQAAEAAPPLRIRYRIRFAKHGLLRWTSHRDLARLWERLVRRANLNLSMTEGFHPKPRISFPSALALGVNGWDEVVEIELAENMPVAELFQLLVDDDQPGLTIKSVKLLPERFGKAQLLQSDYTITIPDNVDREATLAAIDHLMTQESVSLERKKKTVTISVKQQVQSVELADDCLTLSLAASDGASLRPNDVLDLIDANDWIENGALISRVHVHLQKEFETSDSESVIRNEASVDQAEPNTTPVMGERREPRDP